MEGPNGSLALDVLPVHPTMHALQSSPNETDSDAENDVEEVTVLDEIERKYLDDEDFDCANTLIIFGTSPCQMATARALELVVLNSMRINASGNLERLATHLRRVSEVDLSNNRINSWRTVAELLEHLPSLKVFNISGNPLSREIKCDLPECNRLSTLILNGSCPSMSSMRELLSKMPHLEELHVSDNDLRSAEIADDVSPISKKISVLNLSNCCLETWDNVIDILRFFPNCTRLILGSNGFSSITKSRSNASDLSTRDFVSSVQSLCLNGCNFQNWDSVESIALFPALEDLRIRNVPLFEKMAAEERHHLVVGRLPLLKTLNGSVLTADRREESERFFLRFYQQQQTKPAIYDTLVGKHGHVEQLANVDLTPKKHAVVEFSCEETGLKKSIQVKLTITVQNLKTKAEQLTGISAKSMRVFHFDRTCASYGIPNPIFLSLPQQTLRALHVKDGDRFEFQSKISGRNRKPAVTKTMK